ncbi:MAG: choice-of-anchor J domain-containing protein [Dysgonomonas sp.]
MIKTVIVFIGLFLVSASVFSQNVIKKAETKFNFLNDKSTISYNLLPEQTVSTIKKIEKSLTPQNRQSQTIELPFEEKFSSEDQILQNWTIIDLNNDGFTWTYNSAKGPDGKDGILTYHQNYINDADDYLLSNPIALKTGNNYLTFCYSAESVYYPEALEVWIGTEPDTKKMTLLIDLPSINNTGWIMNVTNFKVKSDGNYYFAFRTKSKKGMLNLNIDDIIINRGEYEEMPDLYVMDIILSPSGCYFPDTTPIGVVVTNGGSKPIFEFNLSYKVNDNLPVSQTFDRLLDIKQADTIYFDNKANLSAIGIYEISVTGYTVDDVNVNNDSISSIIEHSLPVTLPFTSSFTDDNDVYNWFPSIPKGWICNTDYGYYTAQKENIPLLSKCISLTPGTYRMKYSYTAGFNFLGIKLPDDYYISYGRKNTDIASWKILKEYTEAYTNFEATDEITFTVNEPDDYVFAIIPKHLAALRIKSIDVFVPSEHSVRINDLKIDIPRLMPVNQTNNIFKLNAEVQNNGLNAEENVKVRFKKNDVVFDSYDNIILTSDEIKTFGTSIDLKNEKVDNIIKLSAEVSIGTEESLPDNYIEKSIQITDTVFAWDNAVDFNVEGIGGEEFLRFGTIFDIRSKAILSSVTIAFAKGEDQNFLFSVYKIGQDLSIQGNPIIKQEFARGTGEKPKTFKFPDVILEPCTYYFEIQQLTPTNIGLLTDWDEAGFIALIDADGKIILDHSSGYAHIRPNVKQYEPLSIHNHNNINKLNIYYDQNTKKLFIKSKGKPIINIAIRNTEGKLIYHENILPTDSHETDCSELMRGLYILTIRTENDIQNIKILIKE